jgi:hypothetical protein
MYLCEIAEIEVHENFYVFDFALLVSKAVFVMYR